jgi:hypothetical protein
MNIVIAMASTPQKAARMAGFWGVSHPFCIHRADAAKQTRAPASITRMRNVYSINRLRSTQLENVPERDRFRFAHLARI